MTPQLRFPEFTDEWQVKKLGDFSSITTGKLDANAMVENGRYRFYTCAREFYKIDQYAFDTEALLVSGNGANVGYIHYYKGKFNAYQRTYVLDNFRENIGYIKLYLDRYLKKRILQEKFEGNMPYIVLSTLKDMPISTPPMKEQEKIADFLTAVDERIGVSEKKLELLETYKRGVMQKIFSQQVRFKDDNGNPYPDWEEKKLGEVASFVSGYTFLSSTYSESGVYKIITIANVQDGRMNVDKASKINTLPSNIQKNQVLERGDVLVSMTGNVGRVCKVNIENCLLNQRVGKIVPKNINADFLFAVLNSRRFLAEMESLAQGGAQGNLSSKDIMRYMIKLPSRDEQQKIADFLTTLDDKITAEKSKLTASRQFKKALLQRMFV